jgi:diaminopimelate epimerase
MKLHFVKMHALGNDFLIVDTGEASNAQAAVPDADTIRRLADRRTGVGFDQLLWIEPSREPGQVAYYRIFNADGGEVEQCGNGARCVAAVVARRLGGAAAEVLQLGSPAGPVEARIVAGGQVEIRMQTPRFEPADVPFDAPREQARYPLSLHGEEVLASVLSIGNPHCVIHVPDIDTADVSRLGPLIESLERFPERVNVEFLEIVDRTHCRLRVHERGVGETRACGTGACAAVVAGRRLDWFDETVNVELPGGTLVVNWRGPGAPVSLSGPATTSFEGTLTL